LVLQHSQTYCLLDCLEQEMNRHYDQMKLSSRQSQILSSVTEWATTTKKHPRDVVPLFFHRMAGAEAMSAFQTGVADFIEKIKKRAVDKRKEMQVRKRTSASKTRPGLSGYASYVVCRTLHVFRCTLHCPMCTQEDEKRERVKNSPGGLDYMDVLEQLPSQMRAAFESQDIPLERFLPSAPAWVVADVGRVNLTARRIAPHALARKDCAASASHPSVAAPSACRDGPRGPALSATTRSRHRRAPVAAQMWQSRCSRGAAP
jgi:hypothetical protein